MLFRVVAALVALTANAPAATPRGHKIEAPNVTALAAAGITKPLRVERELEWGKSSPPSQWQAFTSRRSGAWHAAWDTATGVPNRIWGEGIPAFGATANAAVAERIARQVLADHIALLAPGASVGDFELASNHFDGEMRSIGFYQRAAGKRVVGGQVSFRFKADRLFVIGSEALPHVTFSAPKTRLADGVLRTKATTMLRSELALPASAPVSSLEDEVILPLVADDTVLGYRLVRPLTIDGGADGRYRGYVDVATGAVIAVRQLNAYASGTARYRVVDRHPGRARIDRAAARAHFTINGVPQTSTVAGALSWDGDVAVEVQSGVTGDLVTVVNKADGNVLASGLHPLAPGGAFVWDASASELDDAQVNAYIATMRVKDFVRANIDPNSPLLDEPMTVNVNIANNCNAFWDGKSINFLTAGSGCQNTALTEDVVFHEFGHDLHGKQLIPGVGDFDGSFSEGASDFLAATITNDSGMGRGFFLDDTALRELDPPDKEWMWPRDIGEIHHTGQIYGGIFWDLRKALIEEKGETEGLRIVHKLYVATLRRSINIPTSLVESLAADDDDGNLANGTPNECAIRAAFGRHGIRTATGTVIAPGQLTVNALAIGVHIDVIGLSDRCEGDEIESAELSWLPPYGSEPRAGSVMATPAGGNTYFAQLPLMPNESIYYKAKINYTDGSSLTLADNLGDSYYQLYQGETVKLYCTDFESTDPFAEGWTTGTDEGASSPFQWGIPTGVGTDPGLAYSGTRVLAQRLDGNYEPKQRAWLKSPPIDVGQYSDVRVHYRRWLAVEDAHFDTAMITANDNKAWVNFNSDMGDISATHHVDKEWRFHDVSLSGYFTGHTVTVGWEIKSDAGLELGGWQLDDVCIVANPNAICGDGVKTRTEQCDNGVNNRDAADVCRTDCRLPRCGDEIIDAEEECDQGTDGNEVCTPACKIIPPQTGGCSTGGGGSLALLGLLFVTRPWRTRARRRQAR